MAPLVPPTVVLVMLALLTVAPECVPADTRARRSELQQERETKTQ